MTKYVELKFDSPEHLRETLKILFERQVEVVVEKFKEGVEYFDFHLKFRVRYDSATENSKKPSLTLSNYPKKAGRKLN